MKYISNRCKQLCVLHTSYIIYSQRNLGRKRYGNELNTCIFRLYTWLLPIFSHWRINWEDLWWERNAWPFPNMCPGRILVCLCQFLTRIGTFCLICLKTNKELIFAINRQRFCNLPVINIYNDGFLEVVESIQCWLWVQFPFVRIARHLGLDWTYFGIVSISVDSCNVNV